MNGRQADPARPDPDNRALAAMHAVSELAAGWDRCGPAALACSLAETLSGWLSPALVCVRVPLPDGGMHEERHGDRSESAAEAARVAGSLLARLDVAGPATLDVIEGGNDWRVAIQAFGDSPAQGGLIVCSRRKGFPDANERVLLRSANGHAACMLRTKHQQRDLDRQKLQLQTALDIIGDAVVTTGPEGQIDGMNRIAEELTGITLPAARGRPARELFRIVDQASGEALECPIEQALREHRVVARARPSLLIAADGARHPIEHRATPIVHEQRKIGGVIAFRDVGDRQRADALRERLLREAEMQSERQIQAFHLAPSFMALLRTPQHVFELANARYYRLVGARDIVGKPVRDAMPELAEQGMVEILDRVYRSGEAYAVHDRRLVLNRIPGGPAEERFVDLVYLPLRDADGAVSGILVHGVDQTERTRAELALRERDTRLQLFLDNATDYAVIITDRHGRIVEWLGGAEAITGWRADEMVGRSTDVLFVEDDRAQGRPALEMAEASASGRAVDARWHQRKDGSRFFADGVTVSLREPGGELRGFGKLFRDITAQKRDADELSRITSESERRRRLYEAALSNTPDLVFVLDLDRRFIYANEALLQVWGRSWSDAIGRNFHELGYPAWQAAMHDREIEQVIRTGRPVRGEVPFGGPHGCRIHDYILVPVIGAGNEVEAVAGTTRDVTERKRSEERFSQVAAASQRINTSLSLDEIARTTAEQARHITGAAWAVLSLMVDGALTASALAPAGRPAAADALLTAEQRALAEDACRNHAARRLTRGGRAGNHPPGLAAPLIGHGGRVLGAIQLIDRDGGEFGDADEAVLAQLAAVAATGLENARLYDSLRLADQRKDEFLATLAHELRNPLAPMRYAIELMRSSGDRQVREESREMAGRQIDHLVRLVDDLLDVARISTGKLTLRRQPVDLLQIVRSAVETSRPAIERAAQHIEVQLPDAPVMLDADPARLGQVLLNLLNNAIKYSEAGGTIRVTACVEGEQVVLRVSDDGIGIDPAMLPHIFELFSQAEHDADRAQGGLGIGLTLVKRLVELHDGSVEAISAGRGHGSEFVVRLPLPAHLPATAEQAATSGAKDLPARRRRVLVVDDNRDAANSLAFLLEAFGHDTRVAFDGPTALPLAESFGPDVAVLDIGMPGMDGFELARRLRALPGLSDVRLIALTGWGQAPDRQRSRDAGFDHHLVKPADLAELKRLVADPE